MLKEPFVLVIAALAVMIAMAGCAPSQMTRDSGARRTVIEGYVQTR